MGRKSDFPVSIPMIIMALLALFVGYLLGNWALQLLVGGEADTVSVLEEKEQEKIIEEEIILEDNGSQISRETAQADNNRSDFNFEDENVFAVQVGAFSSRENAEKLKQELEAKGFPSVVTEGVPYKVQLGATADRLEAEETERKMKDLGYEAFITH